MDITKLTETNKGPVQVCLNGCGAYGNGSDFSIAHYQRPGLLFLDSGTTGSNNVVYAAFSMIDGGTGDPNGFIWAYNAHDLSATPLMYETTPGTNKRRGGIWQAGAGLMASTDANGVYHLYFSTGDGDFDLDQQQAPNTDAADSFLKLTTDLGTKSVSPQPNYFTPSDQFWRGCNSQQYPNDKDFGSGGPIAIPESTFSPPAYYAVKLDKENYVWVMDRTYPGGYNGGGGNQNCGGTQNCKTPCANVNNNQESFLFTTAKNCTDLNQNSVPCEDRSTPAFWSGKVQTGDLGELYLAGTADQIMRFAISSSCNPAPICNTAAATSNIDPIGNRLGYSVTPSVSWDGTHTNTGIVWLIVNIANGNDGSSGNQPAILYALAADTLTELYGSNQNSGDQIGVGTAFSVPTVANGLVMVGTRTDFDIFGCKTVNCQ